MALCCVRDRLALQILFSGPSTAACSPHGVAPPGEEVSSLSGPSRPLMDVSVKNSKNQDELALDSNSKEKSNRFTSPSPRIKALHLDFADSLLKQNIYE